MSADPVTFATKQDIQTVVYKIEQGEIALGTNTAGNSTGASSSARVDFTSEQTLSNKTLIEPTIASIKNGTSTVVVPQKSGTIALTSDLPTIGSNNGQIDISNFATLNGEENLRNKTLEAPKISTIVNANTNNTLTLPTSAGTIALTSDLSTYVTKTGEETLTNKTLTSPKINQIIASNGKILTIPTPQGVDSTYQIACLSDVVSSGLIHTAEISGMNAEFDWTDAEAKKKHENRIYWTLGHMETCGEKLYIGYIKLDIQPNELYDSSAADNQNHTMNRKIGDAIPTFTGLRTTTQVNYMTGNGNEVATAPLTIEFNSAGIYLEPFPVALETSNNDYIYFSFIWVKPWSS